MSTTQYTEKFKAEAVDQVVGKGYRVAHAAARLGVSQRSLYEWIKERRLPAGERQAQATQSEEVRRLKAKLKRVTEERDILKKAAAYFAKQCG